MRGVGCGELKIGERLAKTDDKPVSTNYVLRLGMLKNLRFSGFNRVKVFGERLDVVRLTFKRPIFSSLLTRRVIVLLETLKSSASSEK
jgi:hypothetical protein